MMSKQLSSGYMPRIRAFKFKNQEDLSPRKPRQSEDMAGASASKKKSEKSEAPAKKKPDKSAKSKWNDLMFFARASHASRCINL